MAKQIIPKRMRHDASSASDAGGDAPSSRSVKTVVFPPPKTLGDRVCLDGSFIPAPGIHISKESGMFRWKLYPSLPLQLPQTRLHPWESPSNDDHYPKMLKTTPTGYLNCPPENKHVTRFSCLPSLSPLSGGLKGYLGVLVVTKPFLIQFDLVWFGL